MALDAERLYDQVGQRLGLGAEDAARVTEACLVALHLRMREPAAREVAALLPPELRRLWAHGGEALKERRGAVSDFSRLQFLNYVGDRLGLRDHARVERTVQTFFEVFRSAVPQADPLVRREVPEDIRDLWVGPAAARPPG